MDEELELLAPVRVEVPRACGGGKVVVEHDAAGEGGVGGEECRQASRFASFVAPK